MKEAEESGSGIATGWPVFALVGIAFLEVLINRVLIGTRTEPGLASAWIELNVEPPTWYDALSYLGLFLFYFSSALAAVVVFARTAVAIMGMRSIRDVVAHGLLLVFAALSVAPIVTTVPDLALPLEILFALALVAIAVNTYALGRDLGAQIGMVFLAIPLVVHVVVAFGARFVWVETITFDGPVADVTRFGVFTLTVAALASPYCFGPRPFAHAVTKPIPVVVAMMVAALGATAAHLAYPKLVNAASLAIGVELTSTKGDPLLAIYLLSVATLVWTLASCFLAAAPARRMIGAGIALIVLGGYAFKWPNHYLLPLLGLSLVAEAARTVRDEELAALPLASSTPPISDAGWATYVGTVIAGLRRVLGEVHGLTTRGEGGLVSTVFVGDKAGLPVRVRVERVHGSVAAIDVVIGREIDEVRGATLVLWAMPTAENGPNPAGPPAAPVFRSNDAAVDAKFRVRGNQAVFDALFDEGLRGRAVTTLDGWLAYWEKDGLRYRVYPGHGSPLDHPIPLSDLALGRPATAERMVAVVELLVELAGRGIAAQPTEPPQELVDP